MKLLLASDLHCDREAAQSLVRRSAAVDVVVIAGDFGNARRGLAQCIEILQAIDRPTVVVAGNNESTPELQQACANWPSAVVLHGTGTEIDGVPFFGLGGGIPVTPSEAGVMTLPRKRLPRCCKTAHVVACSFPTRRRRAFSISRRAEPR